MDKTKKQIQNRNRYLRNREKVLIQAKERREKSPKKLSNVIPFFKNGEIPLNQISSIASKAKRSALKINREVLFLSPLIALMTYYLVSESARFYQFAEGDASGAYLKALIAEGIVLVFAASKAPTPSLRWLYRGVLGLACIYSLWALSAKTVSEAVNRGVLAIQSQKAATELELELEKRIATRNRLFELNRVTLARSYDSSIDAIQIKLEKMRHSAIEAGSPLAIANTVITLVLFRTIVMIANALCVHRLKRGLRFRQYASMAG
jgi:hypothetical protein